MRGNDGKRRQEQYPELYGTPDCPGAGIRHDTPRKRQMREFHQSVEFDHENKRMIGRTYRSQKRMARKLREEGWQHYRKATPDAEGLSRAERRQAWRSVWKG